LANVILITEAQSVSLIDIAHYIKACTFADKPREANSCCTGRITNKNIHTTSVILIIFAESKPHNWIICIMWNAEPLSARLKKLDVRCDTYTLCTEASIGVHSMQVLLVIPW